jgi:hypothetical protein
MHWKVHVSFFCFWRIHFRRGISIASIEAGTKNRARNHRPIVDEARLRIITNQCVAEHYIIGRDANSGIQIRQCANSVVVSIDASTIPDVDDRA